MPKATKEPTGANAVFVERAKIAKKRAIVFQSSMKNGYEGLSNFTVVDPPFAVPSSTKGYRYVTTEHYFQSEKAEKMGLPGLARRIRAMPYGTREELILVKHAASRKAMVAYIMDYIHEEPDIMEMTQKLTPELIAKLKSGTSNIPTKAHIERTLNNAVARIDQATLMRIGLKAKFSQHAASKKLLQDTGDAMLGENSFRSGEWGIGKDGSPGIMGTLLMEIRSEFISK
jgi:predicted NAD-dependent protein-ADP-ribosyltransferase YbiA (DUF1768 family)